MHTLYHAKSSAKKWGGEPEEYLPVHEFLDQSKVALGDVRHRAALHHTLGTRLAEQALGAVLTLSTGREVPVREVAERHIIEDLGWLPTPADWFKTISLRAVPWAGGHPKALKRKGIALSPRIPA